MLFELSHSLCKAYPALSPFDVDEKPFGVVISTFGDMITLSNKEAKIEKIKNDPNYKIMRPAGDDWF